MQWDCDQYREVRHISAGSAVRWRQYQMVRGQEKGENEKALIRDGRPRGQVTRSRKPDTEITIPYPAAKGKDLVKIL